jgi:HPt (histidine-containing phosphotransfer) domain-containing protein
LRRVGGDVEFAAEMVQIFMQEQHEMCESLRRAVADGRSSEIERAAHSLKGALGSMGATRSAGAAFQIEQSAGRGEQIDDAAIARFLDGDIVAVVAELGEYLRRSAAA